VESCPYIYLISMSFAVIWLWATSGNCRKNPKKVKQGATWRITLKRAINYSVYADVTTDCPMQRRSLVCKLYNCHFCVAQVRHICRFGPVGVATANETLDKSSYASTTTERLRPSRNAASRSMNGKVSLWQTFEKCLEALRRASHDRAQDSEGAGTVCE